MWSWQRRFRVDSPFYLVLSVLWNCLSLCLSISFSLSLSLSLSFSLSLSLSLSLSGSLFQAVLDLLGEESAHEFFFSTELDSPCLPRCSGTVWRTPTRASTRSSTTTCPRTSATRSARWCVAAHHPQQQLQQHSVSTLPQSRSSVCDSVISRMMMMMMNMSRTLSCSRLPLGMSTTVFTMWSSWTTASYRPRRSNDTAQRRLYPVAILTPKIRGCCAPPQTSLVKIPSLTSLSPIKLPIGQCVMNT